MLSSNILQKKHGRKFCLSFALALASLTFTQTAVDADTLPLKSYTTSDGLAHDRVDRIVRDSRGFLWFCTAEGLSRFDGYEFKNYTQDDGLPHRAISDMLETSSGELWLGTGDGVVLFDPHGRSARVKGSGENIAPPMFRVIRAEPGSSGGPVAVVDLLQDRTGVIWAATSAGIYILEKGEDWQLRKFPIPASIENKNEDFSRLLEDRSGGIWGATESGLYRVVPDRSSTQTIHNKLRAGSMIEGPDGSVWIGSVGGAEDEIGLHVYSVDEDVPRKIRTYRKSDGLVDESWLNGMLKTRDGRIFVGIGNGLSEFVPGAAGDQKAFRIVSKEGVVAIGEDAAGNVWFSTNSNGVRRLARGGFVRFSSDDNLPEKRITSIVSSSDGNVYVLAEVDKILRYDGEAFTSIKPLGMIPQSWGRGEVSFRDHTGAWWIAGGSGLQRYPPVARLEDLGHTAPIRTYTTRDGLFGDVIFQLFEDSRGDVWIGIISGEPDSLARWERSTDTIQRYTTGDGLPRLNPVSALGEDSAGNVWIGYYSGGLARYRRGKFEFYDAEDGLPPGYIPDIYCDSAGRVWVATSNGGAVRIDEPNADDVRLTNVTTRDGLSSNQVTCTTEDLAGRIYISTGRGVNRLDTKTGRVKVFTMADGLPENVVTRCRRDSSGALWFGTWGGLARYLPETEEQIQPPPVFLSDLRVNGESVGNLSQLGETVLDKIDLASDQRQVQVDFFALGFGVGESLRYQYKLDGIETEWSEPSAQRTVSLNLSPGSYSFLVRAINAEGMISERPARLAFSISRPVWQQWWFLLILAVAIALTAYLVYRYRLGQLLKLERVRTRIATDLHDDIGSSLSQIAILSEVARHKAGENGAAEPLRRIAETSRDLVDSMSDIVWAINPQKDHLSDLVQRMRRFAGDTFDATDVGYRFRFDDSRDVALGAVQRRELFLVFNECVNNSAKHSGAESVEIEVTIDGEQVRTEIKDTGRGFDVSEAMNGEIKDYGGNGLLNIRKRVERLGGQIEIESEKGKGTRVMFSIPTNVSRTIEMGI
jgi:signal transduction histidine kinase/ligand-binding sensor domain-containing protein